MIEEKIEQLDPELDRLFRSEARFPEEADGVKARVWERVQGATIYSSLDHGDGGEGGASGAAPSPGIGEVVATPAVSIAPSKLAAVVLGAFTAGAVAGAVVYRAAGPDPAPMVLQIQEVADEGADQMAPTETARQTRIEPPSQPDQRPTPKVRKEVRPKESERANALESQLARERALIDVARTAIARGHTQSAFAAIERHQRAYPEGRLAEEREGLRVIALVKAGRISNAQEKLRQFRRLYPQSLLLPAIESAVGPKP